MANVTFDKNLETGELKIVGLINAPVEKVWEAWTKPELFARWWGPRGWETTVKEFDLKPGGTMLYGMKCVDESQKEWFGKESWGKMEFTKVEPQKEISYIDYFSDAEGRIDDSMPSAPTTLLFEEADGGTRLVNITTYESGDELKKVIDMGMEQGVTESWERLEELVRSTE